MKILKRTFEALKHPKGSDERNRLNEDSATSEYMPSHKYALKGENFTSSYRTRSEAEAAKERMEKTTANHNLSNPRQ